MFFLHLDTLYFSAVPRDATKYKFFYERLKFARENGQKTIGKYEVLGRWQNYSVGFVNQHGFHVYLADEKSLGDSLPVFVRVPAEVMLYYWEQPELLLEHSGIELGGFNTNKINRADITLDSDECTVTPSWIKKLKCRSRSGTWVRMEDTEKDDKLSNYIQSSKFTGITRGCGDSSTVYFRIYDKLEELKRTKKMSVLTDILTERGWKDKTVWRFEWELKREKLKDLGFESVEDFYNRLNDVYQWLVCSWVKMGTAGDTCFWSNVQSQKFELHGGPLREKKDIFNITQMELQIAGCLSKIIENNNLTRLEFFHYMSRFVDRYDDRLFLDKKNAHLSAQEIV